MGEDFRLSRAHFAGEFFNVGENDLLVPQRDVAELLLVLVVLGHRIDERAAVKTFLAEPLLQRGKDPRQFGLWIAAAGFFFLAGQAIMAACSQSVWQRKIPPHLAARVLAVRLTLASSTLPAGYLLAGPLADRVFEPLMTPGGALAASLGPLVGVGRGRGIGLFLMVLGVTLLAAAAAAGRIPAIRDVERLLPDALADPI